jgi:hypothetical protein
VLIDKTSEVSVSLHINIQREAVHAVCVYRQPAQLCVSVVLSCVFVKAAPVSWERGEGGLGCNGVADNAQVIDYFNCLPGNKKSAYGSAKSLCFLSTSKSSAVTAKTKKTI